VRAKNHALYIVAALSGYTTQDVAKMIGVSSGRLRAYLRADILPQQVLAYAGRAISASPAVGYATKHNAEQKQLIEDAFAATLKSGEMVVAH